MDFPFFLLFCFDCVLIFVFFCPNSLCPSPFTLGEVAYVCVRVCAASTNLFLFEK